jgi:predicted ArsR family transcriptional regulator
MDDARIRAVAALEDETRARIFALVRASIGAVSRKDVAAALGISPKRAAFHLDTLEERGLVRTHFARPDGRSGPGAGRPSKMYEATSDVIEVSIPPRRYDVAGRLLMEAVLERTDGEGAVDAGRRVSRRRGIDLGGDTAASMDLRRPDAERALAAAESALSSVGFEPYRSPRTTMRLRNCPFQALAAREPGLMCEMTRSFVAGVVEGIGSRAVEASPESEPGDCCVVVSAIARG